VSLLLHLSDLHLAAPPTADEVGNYKIDAIPELERQSRVKLLRQTLDALRKYLDASNETLDAVVVTGDVTTACNPAGFAQLTPMLELLGSALPAPDKIVVVPGNHDVLWGTPPSSSDRYRYFVDGIRAAGFVTPLLDGVDYKNDLPNKRIKPYVLGKDFLIVAMNTADMCGLVEPMKDGAQLSLDSLVASGTFPELVDEVSRLRTYDMPRMSQRQMVALATIADSARRSALDVVTIAAMHHQIAPVQTEEEVKPFESLVNLGEVRAFLADRKFDAVLHGHKHVQRTVTDVFAPYGTGASTEHRLVVSSCATVGKMTAAHNEIAKLIRIRSELPSLRRIEIYSIPAVSAGTSLKDRIRLVFSGPTQRSDPELPVVVVSGKTATAVHERLLELAMERAGASVSGLICTVEDGSTALEQPQTFPSVPTFDVSPTEWFQGTVEWWQDEQLAEGKPFTHGQRLRNWPVGVNQFEGMIKALGDDPSTSRAIAVLINPATDHLSDKAVQFPSFALLHFRVVDDRLHCNAFFRKQEMRYWWAINVAEIAKLQSEVLQRLLTQLDRVVAGPIRTFTSEAVFSELLPKVNVPQVDRLAWTDSAQMWTMAVAVADVRMNNRSLQLARLVSLMEEWRPTGGRPQDGAVMPEKGLKVLSEALEALAPLFADGPAAKAADLTRHMDEVNTNYRHLDPAERLPKAYQRWRKRQIELLDRFAELISGSLAGKVRGGRAKARRRR
jgi:3',5'-cyclic AMP phosphodiesterase CpdA